MDKLPYHHQSYMDIKQLWPARCRNPIGFSTMRAVVKRQLITLATYVVASVALPQQPFDLDLSFRTTFDGNFVTSIAYLSEPTLLLAGGLRPQGSPNWLPAKPLAKISLNGSLISSYPPAGEVVGGAGHITPWGDKFYVYGGIPYRLLADAQRDPTFDYNNTCTGLTYAPDQPGDYFVFPDGRVVLTGTYSIDLNCESLGLFGLIWLTNTGAVDTTRTPRTSTYSIYKIKELPTGKFICFTPSAGQYEGIPTERIFRIEPDGELDTTFHAPHIQYGFVNTFYPLASGKVLVGGWFKVNAFADTLSWMRLLPDGNIDMTFNNHMAFQVHNGPPNIDPSVMDFLPIGSDKMVITGAFDELASVTRGGIAMVDTAGNLLDDYFLGNGCSSFIGPQLGTIDDGMVLVGISPAPDGSFYIYGQYRGYDDGTSNDTLQGFVSHLFGLNVGIADRDQFKPSPLAIAPNPTTGNTIFTVEAPLQTAQLTLYDASGRVALQMTWPAGSEQCQLPTGTLAPGAYVANVRTGANTRYSGRLVVLP